MAVLTEGRTEAAGRRGPALVFIRYYTVAALVAAGYLAVYGTLLAVGVHYYVAILIAQACTIAFAFPVYRRFVFRSSGHVLAAFGRFLAVWSSGMVAGFALTPVLVELLSVAPFWAQLMTMVAVSLASFLLHRFFTFRRTPERDQTATSSPRPT